MADIAQRIYEWLARLHTLTAGSSSTEEARLRIELLAPVIAEHFDVSAFTQSSLNAVSAQCRFWPTSGELVAALREWRQSVRPAAVPAIAGPQGRRRLEGMDLHWLNYFRRREAEGFSPVNGVRSSREHVLSLVKQESISAWSEITGIIPQSLAPTEAEIAYVSRLIRPAQERAQQSGQPEPDPERPKPSHMTGEALRQSRAARGCNVPVAEPRVPDDPYGGPPPMAISPQRSPSSASQGRGDPATPSAPVDVGTDLCASSPAPDPLDELLPEGSL